MGPWRSAAARRLHEATEPQHWLLPRLRCRRLCRYCRSVVDLFGKFEHQGKRHS